MSDPTDPGRRDGLDGDGPRGPAATAEGVVPPTPSQERPGTTGGRARRTVRRAMLAGISLVWLVPILALVVTLGLAWNSWSGRGTLIHVSFADATGITPGETVLRFREVSVGRVESVRFSGDLSRVILDIRVDKDIAKYIDDEAQFWIVRPQVSASGISRLDTVLTGVFVEGDWDSVVKEPSDGPFAGLDRAPLTRANEPGSWVILSSDTAKGLSEGAPIFYRGVTVGRMENIRLSPSDEGVLADVFVEAPHNERLTTSSVFWNTAGVSVSLGAQGLALNVGSLSSILQGGVQFETLTSGGDPVPAGQTFHLNANEDEARNSLFTEGAAGEIRLTVLVDNGLRGLSQGADVQFEGLNVGRVTDLKLRVQPGPNNTREVQQEVTIAVLPVRLGLPPETTREQTLAFLAGKVAEGMRARVASAGFLGTSLMIELADVPDVAPATLDVDGQPYPVIPSAPGDLSDFTATAQGFISKVGQLPLNETLRSAQDMMNSITALASSQEVRQVPGDVSKTLADAQKTIAEVQAAVADLRASGAMERAGGAVDAMQRAGDAVAEAAAGVPEAIRNFDRAAQNIAAVDMAALADAATGAADGVRTLVAGPDAQGVPRQLNEALSAVADTASELRTVARDLRQANTADKLAEMIDAATTAVEAVRVAAADVPDMVVQVEDAANEIEAFDFDGISTEAQGLISDLRAMLGTEDAAQLPRNLSDTLQAAAGLLNDLRDGNAAGSLNALLASAKTATDNISVSVQRLPQLTQRFEALAAQTQAVIAAYGDRSTFNTELIGTLRELRRATAAFGQLASTIERNPRAFILGR